ncbi:biotin--[acetyl-CoA-carboxylase] ligase [Planctomycetota bacterium]|nr:biotin--[acetyl-CoA-carboxylase] ligase [Planctomycetota bacterium]
MPSWLIELPTCPSTNSWALEHAEALAHGACVVTARQTAGRGRDGKIWVSPPGVVTASFVLHAALDDGPQLALAAGLAICHAVEDACPGLPEPLAIKWPNDVWLAGGKLAGVLCERAGPSSTQIGGAWPGPAAATWPALVVGIGLNVDPQRQELPSDRRCAILAEHVPAPSTMALLAGLRRYLLEAAALIADRGLEPVLGELRRRDLLRGRMVEIDLGDRLVTGRAAGLDDHGRLLIDGAERLAITSGTVVQFG